MLRLYLLVVPVMFIHSHAYALDIDWVELLPLHITAIDNCQSAFSPNENPIVVDMRPFIQDVEIDFRTNTNRLKTCFIGAYGGEYLIIRDIPTDAPYPNRFFTLLPSYPEYTCYEHKLIYDFNEDPPEAIGWISEKSC